MNITTMDINVLNFIQQHLVSPTMNKIMPIITLLGDKGIIWILIGLVLLISKKYRKVGVLVIASLILMTILGEGILKNLVRRPRPFNVVHNIKLIVHAPRTFSFPSGHTGASFAAATVLSSTIKKWKIRVWILAVLIAFSRLYLYVHYPTDVLVGAIVGIVSGIIVLKIYNRKYKHNLSL